MTHSAALLALDALAVFRLTRLAIADTVTASLRERLIGRRPAQTLDMGGERVMVAARPRLAIFLGCPWCVSPYLASAVIALQALAPMLCFYLTAALAFSAVAGLLSEHG